MSAHGILEAAALGKGVVDKDDAEGSYEDGDVIARAVHPL